LVLAGQVRLGCPAAGRQLFCFWPAQVLLPVKLFEAERVRFNVNQSAGAMEAAVLASPDTAASDFALLPASAFGDAEKLQQRPGQDRAPNQQWYSSPALWRGQPAATAAASQPQRF